MFSALYLHYVTYLSVKNRQNAQLNRRITVNVIKSIKFYKPAEAEDTFNADGLSLTSCTFCSRKQLYVFLVQLGAAATSVHRPRKASVNKLTLTDSVVTQDSLRSVALMKMSK